MILTSVLFEGVLSSVLFEGVLSINENLIV